MHWLVFESLSILLFSVANILQKALMKDDKSDPHAYSIVFQVLGAVIVGFFAIVNGFNLPPISNYPANFLILGVLYGSGTLFLFNALKNIEASEVTIVTSVRPIITIISAVILLQEPFNLIKGLGTLLILSAVFLVSGKIGNFKFNKGFFYAIGMAICYGLAITNDTFLIGKVSDVLSYLVIGNLLPGVFLILVKPKALLKVNQFLRPNLAVKMFLFTFIYAIAALLFYLAIKNGALASQITPIHQATVVFTVALAFIFLNEKDQIIKKFLASLLVIIGLILLA